MSHSLTVNPSPTTKQTAASTKLTLPYGWIVKLSSSFPDRVYYFNTNTGASTWNVPELVEPYLNRQPKHHSSQCFGFSPSYESENDASPFSTGSDVDYRVSDPVFSQFQKGIFEDVRSVGSTDWQQNDYSVQDVDLRPGKMPHFSSSSRTGATSAASMKTVISPQSVQVLSKIDKDKQKEKNPPKPAFNYDRVHSVSNLLSNLKQQLRNKELNQTSDVSKPDKKVKTKKYDDTMKSVITDKLKTTSTGDVQHSNKEWSDHSHRDFLPVEAYTPDCTKAHSLCKSNCSWSSRKAKEKLSKNLSVDLISQQKPKSTFSSSTSKVRRVSASSEPVSYEDFCANEILPTSFGCRKISPSKKVVSPRQVINTKKVKSVAADQTDLRHRITHRERLKENKPKDDAYTESSMHLDSSCPDGRNPWTKKRKSSDFGNDPQSKNLKTSLSNVTKQTNDVKSSEKVSSSPRDKIDTTKKPKHSVSTLQKSDDLANKCSIRAEKNKKPEKRKNSKDRDWDLLRSLNTNNSGKTSSVKVNAAKVAKSMKRTCQVSDVRKVIAGMDTIKKVISVKPVIWASTSSSHSKNCKKQQKEESVQSRVDSVSGDATIQQNSTDLNNDIHKKDNQINVDSCSRKFETGEADRRIVLPSCTVSPFSLNDSLLGNLTSNSSTPMVFSDRNANFNDDVCDMEVDDEDIQMIVDLKEVRQELKFHHNKAVGELTLNVACDSEAVTESKSSRAPDKALYIVIDTNVLIHDLKFLTELRDTKLEGFGLPYLLIPWVVMQELDYLKGSKQSMSARGQRKAQMAVSYLFACFQSKHPRVRGQSSKKASETLDGLQIECNDDYVLQAVHQCMKENENSCVVLLSGDKNLCNKAIVNGIEVYGRETLYKGLLSLGINYRKKECTSLPEKSPGYSGESIHTTDVCTQNVSSSSFTRCADPEMEMVDEVLCKAKDIITEGFGIVLKTEMEEAFGNMWHQIVYRKPPWSAYDVMQSIQKHWMAVFGLVFKRRLLKTVDRIVTKLSPNEVLKLNELKELLRESLVVLTEFKHNSLYNGIVPRSIKQIENLLRLCQGNQKVSKLSYLGDSVQVDSKPSEQTSRLSPVSFCDNKTGKRNRVIDASSELESEKRGMKCSFVSKSIKEPNSVPVSPVRTVIPKDCVFKTDVMNNDENMRRAPAVLLNPRPMPKKQQVVLPTVSSLQQKNVNPQVPEESKKCHDSVAEALINVQNAFQTIWETINNWCNAIQCAIKKPTPSSTKESDMILRKLVPIVTDLRHKYHQCLSFPPLSIRNEQCHFDDLCSHLNMFFIKLDMQPRFNNMVTTNDLLVYFGTLDKRPTLQAGLIQLDNMVQGLYESVKQMPD